MTFKLKYHHLNLSVYTQGEKWKVKVEYPPHQVTLLDNEFDSPEIAKDNALIAADGHLHRWYKDIQYESLPATRIRWIELQS